MGFIDEQVAGTSARDKDTQWKCYSLSTKSHGPEPRDRGGKAYLAGWCQINLALLLSEFPGKDLSRRRGGGYEVEAVGEGGNINLALA